MKTLKLHRPLVFFDLETTGTQIGKDHIVEIALLKIFPDATEQSKTWRVNPQMPIPPVVSAIHGIKDEDVKDAPIFKEIGQQILNFLDGADLAGYNSNKFDVPLLVEELLRNGFDFDLSKHKLVDVQVIFYKMEPRSLSAAYKFYCDKVLEQAHTAMADTRATYEVLKAQLDKYEQLPNEVKTLQSYTAQNNYADLAGFLAYDSAGEVIFNFGKHKGSKVKEMIRTHAAYVNWMLENDFPLYTKKILTRLKLQQ